MVKNIVDKLGTGRVYHLTLSPDMLTAKQVADGAFDEEYKAFFKDIKRFDLKVDTTNIQFIFLFNIHDMPVLR